MPDFLANSRVLWPSFDESSLILNEKGITLVIGNKLNLFAVVELAVVMLE